MKKIVYPETTHTSVTPEQIVYEAIDGSKHLTQKECEERDRWVTIKSHVLALDRFQLDDTFFRNMEFYFVKDKTDEDYVLEYLRHYSNSKVYTKGDSLLGTFPRWMCVLEEWDDNSIYPSYDLEKATVFKLVLQDALARLG